MWENADQKNSKYEYFLHIGELKNKTQRNLVLQIYNTLTILELCCIAKAYHQ